MVRNGRYNGGLPPLNVFFDEIYPCQIQVFFHWWPFPPAVPRTLSCLSRSFSGHPIMKPFIAVIIDTVTTQLSPPYRNTYRTTALYIICDLSVQCCVEPVTRYFPNSLGWCTGRLFDHILIKHHPQVMHHAPGGYSRLHGTYRDLTVQLPASNTKKNILVLAWP